MTLLITGGAGYIGGQTALVAMDAGREVLVIDDMSTGRAVPPGATFVEADAGDAKTVARLMRRHGVTEVIHFAASVVAPRSVGEPLPYYRNNVGTLMGLLEACAAAGVIRLVFSSTAAVYGEGVSPAREDAQTRPVSPYGESKLMAEKILRDVTTATGMQTMVLRYFNVAGADPEGRAGPNVADATHLFTVACEVASRQRSSLIIHGNDWPTRDGTGVRDYIHVHDVARAHSLALERLNLNAQSESFSIINLGSGRGYSVREVIDAVSKAARAPLPFSVGARRPGDVAEMVADTRLASSELGWRPRFTLDEMAKSAFDWQMLQSNALVLKMATSLTRQ